MNKSIAIILLLCYLTVACIGERVDRQNSEKLKIRRLKGKRKPRNKSEMDKRSNVKGGKKGRGKRGGRSLSACISAYPGSNSSVSGKVFISFDLMDMTIKYDMEGLEADLNIEEPGGLHMHAGTTCSDASLILGKHWNDYGDAESNPHPWTKENDAIYLTDEEGSAKGSFKINNGYYWGENQGHIIIFHAKDGTGVGCGVLTTEKIRGC